MTIKTAANPAGETAPDATVPANEGALAAMRDALAGVPATPPELEPLDAETLEAIGESADPALTEPADPAPAAPEAEPVADAAAAKPSGEGEAVAADAVKPGEKPADTAPAAKPSDEFGELPKDAKQETRDRFDKLRNAFDTQAGKLQDFEKRVNQAEAERDQWIEVVKSTGADADQFGMTLSFLKDFNSGTVEGMERAWGALMSQVEVVAKVLGKEVPGVYDPLTAHPDLHDRVVNDGLDRDAALEIAASREGRKFQQAAAQQRQQAEQQTQQQVEADREAKAELAKVQAFGAQMRATDPLFAQKMVVLEPTIKRVIGRLPPSEWDAEIRALYAEVRVAPPAQAPSTPAPARVPDSIRPGGQPRGAGSVNKEPGSVMEAVRMALGKGG